MQSGRECFFGAFDTAPTGFFGGVQLRVCGIDQLVCALIYLRCLGGNTQADGNRYRTGVGGDGSLFHTMAQSLGYLQGAGEIGFRPLKS